MGGNSEGARKAVETKKKKYGKDYFSKIGTSGGIKSTPGGFGTSNRGLDGLTGPERALRERNKQLKGGKHDSNELQQDTTK